MKRLGGKADTKTAIMQQTTIGHAIRKIAKRYTHSGRHEGETRTTMEMTRAATGQIGEGAA